MSMSTIGKGLMIATNFAYACGAFIADWNETHVLNPNWPPHARFHNGQTMSLGVCLFAATTYLLVRPAPSKEAAKDNVWLAALVGTMYTVAALSAIFYPGSDWHDPEYVLDPPVQLILFPILIVVNWIGWYLVTKNLEAKQMGKSKSG